MLPPDPLVKRECLYFVLTCAHAMLGYHRHASETPNDVSPAGRR